MNKFNLIPLLDYIDPATLDYQSWVNVGMALHYEGYSVDDWEAWSQRDVGRYHPGECESKWKTFSANAFSTVTGATITQLAKERGWISQKDDKSVYTIIDWDKPLIAEPLKVIDTNWIEGSQIEVPTDSNWRPIEEIKTYLRTLFQPDEYVGYVTEAYRYENDEGDIRYSPSKGSYSRTMGQLIDELDHYGKIEDVFGTINEEVGAWIRFNPLDGKGVKNENVTDYRYALIESDDMNIEKQKAILEEMNLPIATLTYSGGKSIHAIVRIDAESYETYRKRVDHLYKVMEKNGFKVDVQNRNPSRLSRLPGVMRNGKKQFLIATNIGAATFEEWERWLEDMNDDLPEEKSLADVWGNMPPLAPPLIHGVLRQGHKMLIAGPSKAGKSYALVQLCIAIAEGEDWLGFNCAQGKVLYINLEVDDPSCFHRFYEVYKAKELEPSNINNIDIWNLRGHSAPLDKLVPKIVRRAVDKGYIAVLIDPIYKVITGDENSADQMSYFCNQFDKICTELKCAVIYCHHHSKGAQGGKKSMDRASGSGVFARDPDALLDFLEVEISPMERTFAGIERPSKGTAWRIEGTLREFERFAPRDVWFEYPCHVVDESGYINKVLSEDLKTKGGRRSGIARAETKKNRQEQVKDIYEMLTGFDPNAKVSIEEVANQLGVSDRTARRYIQEGNEFEIYLGNLVPKKEV